MRFKIIVEDATGGTIVGRMSGTLNKPQVDINKARHAYRHGLPAPPFRYGRLKERYLRRFLKTMNRIRKSLMTRMAEKLPQTRWNARQGRYHPEATSKLSADSIACGHCPGTGHKSGMMFLFDEPTSALDPKWLSEVLNTMKSPGRGDDNGRHRPHEMGFASSQVEAP